MNNCWLCSCCTALALIGAAGARAGETPINGVDGYVAAMAVVSNEVLIAGQFTTVGGLKRPSIAKLYSDGRLDASFNPALAAASSIDAMAVQPDGKIVISGYFPDTAAPFGAYNLLRLAVDGSIDGIPPQPNGSASAILIQSNGRIVIGGGSIAEVSGTARLRIAAFNADLTFDIPFEPSLNVDSDVYSFAEQANGDILIAGRFMSIADASTEIFANSLARVDSSGNVDSSFFFPIIDNGVPGFTGFPIDGVQVLSSGEIVVGGIYGLSQYGYTTISIHKQDGTLDDSVFMPNTLGGPAPNVLTVQADGKILTGGVFTQIGSAANPLNRNNIGRLNTDGMPDAQFVASTNPGPGGQVISILPTANGTILVGGAFTQMDDQPELGIARLLPDGEIDTSFNVNDDIFRGTFDP